MFFVLALVEGANSASLLRIGSVPEARPSCQREKAWVART